MAGHSQFKNIMHRKGRQDAVKSKLFGKLAREITVSAKLGLPDPAMNPRLRAAIIAARAENMPKDNIERAIKKAPGGEGENYEEIRYEGYGPGGVAVIVEVLTDNRNRTAGEVRVDLHQERRQSRRDRRGLVHVRPRRRHRIRRQGRRVPRRCSKPPSKPAPTTWCRANSGHEVYAAPGAVRRGRQGAGAKIRRAAQGGAGLEAAEHRDASTTSRARSFSS